MSYIVMVHMMSNSIMLTESVEGNLSPAMKGSPLHGSSTLAVSVSFKVKLVNSSETAFFCLDFLLPMT